MIFADKNSDYYFDDKIDEVEEVVIYNI